MEKPGGYASRAWSELTSDAGWWKAILALGLLNCVPIVGQVLCAGYLYDWAKEGAWGMKRPLPHEPGDFARRCKYGLYWLACALVWGLPCYIVGCVLALVPVAGAFLQVACNVLSILALVLSSVGALRSAIYERVYPGLQVGKVMRMANEDLLGLCRAFVVLLAALVPLVVALLLVLIPAAPLAGMIESSGAALLHGTGLVSLIALGLTCVVVGLIVWIAATVCVTLVFAVYVRCIGYWVGQFEPAKWGAPGDAMPFERRRKDAGPVWPDGAEHAAAEGGEQDDDLLVPLPMPADVMPAEDADGQDADAVEDADDAPVAPAGTAEDEVPAADKEEDAS